MSGMSGEVWGWGSRGLGIQGAGDPGGSAGGLTDTHVVCLVQWTSSGDMSELLVLDASVGFGGPCSLLTCAEAMQGRCTGKSASVVFRSLQHAVDQVRTRCAILRR